MHNRENTQQSVRYDNRNVWPLKGIYSTFVLYETSFSMPAALLVRIFSPHVRILPLFKCLIQIYPLVSWQSVCVQNEQRIIISRGKKRKHKKQISVFIYLFFFFFVAILVTRTESFLAHVQKKKNIIV